MSAFHLTREADADLDEIIDYYRDKSRAAGRRLLNAIEKQCRLLARLPGMGQPRDQFGPGVRSSAVWPYVIYFRPVANGVQILRVLHGTRHVDPSMF
jgi:toxin ParE1/3/4